MKQNRIWVKIFTIALLFSSFAVSGAKTTTVSGLVCEYHTNPIGIDVQKPRLSWKMVTTETNVLQSAYEIKVTDQPGKGKTIWNSGKSKFRSIGKCSIRRTGFKTNAACLLAGACLG